MCNDLNESFFMNIHILFRYYTVLSVLIGVTLIVASS